MKLNIGATPIEKPKYNEVNKNWLYNTIVIAATPSSPNNLSIVILNKKVTIAIDRLLTISEEPFAQLFNRILRRKIGLTKYKFFFYQKK